MKSGLFLYRSWVEIDLEQIVKNYKIYKNSLGQRAKVIAVVKANAYGHGDCQVALALSEVGADFFAVSNINEGIRLRQGGILGEILVLGYTPACYLRELAEYRLSQAIVSEEHLAELLAADEGEVDYHIALDLGMKRIGLSVENVENVVKKIKAAANFLKIKGLFTHFPSADSKECENIEFTRLEISAFDEICDRAEGCGIELFHCQNSAAGLLYSSKKANAVRLGISLYGYAPSSEVKLPSGISPALSWKSCVCRVFSVKKGESIGYGRSFFAQKDMTVATVTTGYADGYPRAASSKGEVLICGKRCPVVGRVCMDMMMVDVSDVSGVKTGEVAVLIGSSGEETLTADNIAACTDTISYEILTGISSRVPRTYKE